MPTPTYIYVVHECFYDYETYDRSTVSVHMSREGAEKRVEEKEIAQAKRAEVYPAWCLLQQNFWEKVHKDPVLMALQAEVAKAYDIWFNLGKDKARKTKAEVDFRDSQAALRAVDDRNRAELEAQKTAFLAERGLPADFFQTASGEGKVWEIGEIEVEE